MRLPVGDAVFRRTSQETPQIFSLWDELRFFLEFYLFISKLFVIFVV